jgi:hypothetical protein
MFSGYPYDNRKKIIIFTSKLKPTEMIFKFTLLSDELDDFVRVIDIDPEATFFDLHNAILESVKFEKNQVTTFFLCSDTWEKQQEVTLIEMESSSEYDNLVMDEIKLEELLSDEKQKLIYIFDMISDRAFYMELTDILPGKNVDKPVCVKSQGEAPIQALDEEKIEIVTKINLDESFYGDEGFNVDELDEESFSDMNFDDSTLLSEEPPL